MGGERAGSTACRRRRSIRVLRSSRVRGAVEDVEHPLMQKIRYLDKLVDELAKGKALDKILRQ